MPNWQSVTSFGYQKNSGRWSASKVWSDIIDGTYDPYSGALFLQFSDGEVAMAFHRDSVLRLFYSGRAKSGLLLLPQKTAGYFRRHTEN